MENSKIGSVDIANIHYRNLPILVQNGREQNSGN